MLPVAIIGAGQAGLASSYWLRQQGIAHVVLDVHAALGDNWRKRWDSLRLFSPAKYNALPGMPFPGADWSLGTKDDAADYLAAYAERFELPVRMGERVARLHVGEGYFDLELEGGEVLAARKAIVATGAYGKPWRPAVAEDLPPELPQVHSSAYQNPRSLSGRRVLVVGAGASGQQIARELAVAGREVWLAGPDVPNLPRKFLGRDVYWWMYASGLMRLHRDGWLGKMMYKRSLAAGGDVTVGECMDSLKALGVRRLGHLEAWGPAGAAFEGGEVLEGLEAVVWATGYRHSYDWIEGDVLDENGRVRQDRGRSHNVPGLFFMGLPFMHRPNSSLIGGVGRDAKMVVASIVKDLKAGR